MRKFKLPSFTAVLVSAIVALACGTAGGGSGGDSGVDSYRTIVILGDTQGFVRPGNPRYADFQAQIQWIIDNKVSENIEFVMAVGDLIDSGTVLPVHSRGSSGPGECDDENKGASYRGPYASPAFCATQYGSRGGTESSCEELNGSSTGCFWFEGGPEHCLSCAWVSSAAAEWTRFDAQFDRLLPGGDTLEGIPFLLTKGNHDNPGNDFVIDPDREPEGWNQRYNEVFWDSLDGTYIDRAYEHVDQNVDAKGDSHAWIVQIGAQPVLVVSIPYIAGAGVSPSAQTWAIKQMTAPDHADKPAILLVHHIANVRRAITNRSATVAPNLFLVSGGHTGPREKVFRSNGREIVLETQTDWTHGSRKDTNGINRNDYISLIRFYDDGTMEAFDYSVSGNARHADPSNTISRQPFDILPP